MIHLWTPWRSKYMQDKRDKGGCIFCAAAAGSEDRENLVVWRGSFSFVILNRYPYTTGHIMIAPYQHVSRLNQANLETTQEIMDLVRRAERILEEVYRPGGLNLGMNLGEAAGAGIEQHIHMHVLPRWTGDANFMTTVAETRILPELLADTYAKLAARFLHESETHYRGH
jgi:ATP adenylyltransferase